MPGTSLAYRAAAHVGAALAPALGVLDPKIRAGDRGRRGAAGRLAQWAADRRDRDRPLVWFHASSVGEGLQAESVLAELRGLRPECQLVYTHFSPSAAALAGRLPVDAADFLPYDLSGAVERLLEALTPDLLVFSKLDLWPELATRAATRGTTVTMVAATVARSSGRLRWPVRSLLARGYRVVTAAAAISSEDGERLARLGVSPERIRVLGDPRFDSVVHRVRSVSAGDPLLQLGRGAPTMVAGSTWPGDEAVLLEAFARLHVHRPDARLILVPHEPTRSHLESVEAAALRAGLPDAVRLSAAAGPVPLLLVDRVGVLATLYGSGTMAYVGGGFGRAGLHSVLEPAAWGVPVVFGPRWSGSRDAGLLLEAGGAESLLELGTSEASEALQSLWEGWIRDDARRQAQGRRARDVVERGLGAARSSAELLAGLISSPRLRRSPSAAR
jgi:3-deoxy-D-manno-octulosonic-acid transferase